MTEPFYGRALPGAVVRVGNATVPLMQILVTQRDQHDGMRIGRVGLAPLTGIEHLCPGGQLRRNVDHLPGGQQPLRDRTTDPIRPLDHPHPIRPLRREPAQLTEASRVGAEPAFARSTSRVSRASIVTDRLCGSIPIITRSITCLLTAVETTLSARTGNATSSRAKRVSRPQPTQGRGWSSGRSGQWSVGALVAAAPAG
ncbi:MAG: hypothetical protein WKF73_11570 [Nocardioidaceae bacterium]